MKIALLANWGGTIHGVRWANALGERGHDIHLISAHPKGEPLHKNVTLHLLPFRPPFAYFLAAPIVRNIVRKIKPDLMHVHRVTGYGTLGHLAGFHPRVQSVWGADVYDFPTKGGISKKLVTGNLAAADWICSTSHIMGRQTRSLCPEIKNMTITPFGIDTALFAPMPEKRNVNLLTIGTVKTLEPRYGIDLLIRAFAKVYAQMARERPQIAQKMRLLVAGGGPQHEELESLAAEMGVAEITEFLGRVPHADVPAVLNRLDIYVAASRSDAESFGVAVIEASACGVPVVVADVGGLSEVVEDGVTGLMSERESVDSLATALKNLVLDSDKRYAMGSAGRAFVKERYDWQESVSIMEDVYRQVLATNRPSSNAIETADRQTV